MRVFALCCALVFPRPFHLSNELGTAFDRLASWRTWLPGAAARSGHELDLFEAQMVTALRDKRGNHGLLVSLCTRDHRRLLAAVIVAPLPQADERHMKVAALSGQAVLVALRPFLIANPFEDSFVDEPAKTLSDNLPRDPETPMELVEATQSQESVPNDQQRPSLTDDLEGVCDRTVLAFVGALEHCIPGYRVSLVK